MIMTVNATVLIPGEISAHHIAPGLHFRKLTLCAVRRNHAQRHSVLIDLRCKRIGISLGVRTLAEILLIPHDLVFVLFQNECESSCG